MSILVCRGEIIFPILVCRGDEAFVRDNPHYSAQFTYRIWFLFIMREIDVLLVQNIGLNPFLFVFLEVANKFSRCPIIYLSHTHLWM